MRHFNWKHVTKAIAAFALACVALLWSWNALAELFGGPAAEFRHVIAVLVLAIIARGLVSRRHALR